MFRSVLSLLFLPIPALLAVEIVDWEFALNSSPLRQAAFTAVEVPSEATGTAALASGYFEGSLSLPDLSITPQSQGGSDGIVVRFDRNPAGDWSTTWLAQAFSEEEVRIVDLALTEDTTHAYVVGTYGDEVSFGANQAFLLAQPPTQSGFVAILDRTNGAWLNVFDLGDIRPTSIAVDASDAMYLTGEGVLAFKLDSNGNSVWQVAANSTTIANAHIATRPAPNGQAFSYVLSTVTGAGSDVRVIALEPNGTIEWTKTATSNGDDLAGGLSVSAQGFLSFSLATTDPLVEFEGQLLDQPSPFGNQESYLVRLNSNGDLQWSTRIAQGDVGGFVMTSPDLAHDPNGNVHLAVNFSGSFPFEGRQRAGNGAVGVLTVGDNGVPYHFLESSGPSLAEVAGVAAPLRDEQVLVGHHSGTGTLRFDKIALPADGEKLWAAFTQQIPNQSCFIVRQRDNDPTPPAQFLANLRAVLRGEPGATPQLSQPAEIYREFNYPDLVPGPAGADLGVVGYAAFLSLQDLDLLDAVGGYTIEEDILLETSATISPASYNLAKLNDHTAVSPFSYTFPELCTPVRLYLIDTAVSDPGGSYFSSNAGLTLLDPVLGGFGELIRAPGDTAGIVTSEHGTNVLSLVAGPDEGVAQQTPLTTKIYDIFPAVGAARASALIDALLLARNDRNSAANAETPALILLASNAVTPTSPGDVPALGFALAACTADGIPIVMSAGNNGGLAANYAPSQFATDPAILCTAASTTAGGFYSTSNKGPEVRAIAPGENTIAATEVAGMKTTTTFSGTSASAALTAGALLQFQATNPFLSGDDLISEFLAHSTQGNITEAGQMYARVQAAATGPTCESEYSDWTAWYQLANTGYLDNDDGDIYHNLEEYVFGFNPTIAEGAPHGFGIDNYTSPTLTMGFPIAKWLWDPAATGPSYLLRDGSTLLQITSSTDLVTFSPETVTLSSGLSCSFQDYLTFPVDTSSPPEKFFRVEVTGP